MTIAWTDMARTALDGVRGWRAALRRLRLREEDLGFGAADLIALSLVLDLDDVEAVACPAAALAEALGQAWAEQPGRAPRRVIAAAEAGRHIRLAPLRELDGAPAPIGAVRTLVWGLARGFEPADAAAVSAGTRLRPLAGTSPALWQSGLALLVPAGAEAEEATLIVGLQATLRGDWIDPLALYERVQRLAGKLKGLGHAEEMDGEARGDRIAELEQEIASLKRAALVSQHLMLVDAVERNRGAS